MKIIGLDSTDNRTLSARLAFDQFIGVYTVHLFGMVLHLYVSLQDFTEGFEINLFIFQQVYITYSPTNYRKWRKNIFPNWFSIRKYFYLIILYHISIIVWYIHTVCSFTNFTLSSIWNVFSMFQQTQNFGSDKRRKAYWRYLL